MTGSDATLLDKGIEAAQDGRRDLARRFFQAATEETSDAEAAWVWLASLAEEPREAIGHYQRALSRNPASRAAKEGLLIARLRLGIEQAQSGKSDSAREQFQHAIELDAHSEVAWHWLASLARTPDEARQRLQKVLEINPANEQAQAMLRDIEQELAELARTCPLCGKKAAKSPVKCAGCGALLSLAEPKQFLTHQGANQGQMKAAVVHYEKLLREDPDFSSQFALALALLNLKRWDPAFASLTACQPHDSETQARIDSLLAYKASFAAAARSPEPDKKGSILIVDDSPTVRKLVVLTLEKEGYDVATAADGTEAAERLRAVLPDLILLDVMMPGMDGYQVCKLIRASAGTRKTPVVMLSGKDGFFDKIRGKMAGCSEYITKPFHPSVLIRVAETYCHKPQK